VRTRSNATCTTHREPPVRATRSMPTYHRSAHWTPATALVLGTVQRRGFTNRALRSARCAARSASPVAGRGPRRRIAFWRSGLARDRQGLAAPSTGGHGPPPASTSAAAAVLPICAPSSAPRPNPESTISGSMGVPGGRGVRCGPARAWFVRRSRFRVRVGGSSCSVSAFASSGLVMASDRAGWFLGERRADP
jgi:hypothetical protein